MSVAYTYDGFGSVLTHQGVAYGYDAAGRLERMTYPSGAVVTYAYDAAGQVNAVDLTRDGAIQALATGIGYAPFGPVESLTYGNGKTLNQALDSAYRFTAHSVPGALDLTGATYDPVGNLTARTDGLAAVAAHSYGYDALSRLTQADGEFGTRSYTYDLNGNRLSLADGTGTSTYAYAPGSNRLDQAANDDVTLDANGNTLVKGPWTYAYTAHNRLAEAREAGALRYAARYNALGQRVQKTDALGQSTRFVYGLGGELLAEIDASGTVTSEYVHLNAQPLALLRGGAVYAIHTDHLGTPRAITDQAGTLVWTWRSTPFGAAAANDDADGNGQGLTFNLRFPGQYFDAETGLHYNYFRDYDPSTGRYVESDPIGLDGGVNTYAYVDENPLRFIDLYGLSKFDKFFGLPKKFWQWYHRNEKRPGDPDLDHDSARELYKEWKEKGSPGPDSKDKGKDMFDFPDPFSLSTKIACREGVLSCDFCRLMEFYHPCDDWTC